MARKRRKHNTAQAAMPVSPFISTALYIRLSVEDNLSLIHILILMIQYERKGATVMSHTPAYTVIQTPETDKLADIRDVSDNKDLPRKERIAEFIRQIRDPYHCKCCRFVVRASFSQEGATLEECLRGIRCV